MEELAHFGHSLWLLAFGALPHVGRGWFHLSRMSHRFLLHLKILDPGPGAAGGKAEPRPLRIVVLRSGNLTNSPTSSNCLVPVM